MLASPFGPTPSGTSFPRGTYQEMGVAQRRAFLDCLASYRHNSSFFWNGQSLLLDAKQSACFKKE